jgi:type I restriction enzyme M protein
VDCIVALPSQLFFTTQIPVCLWLLDRDKGSSSERDRKGGTLFIDARQMGEKISRTQIELTEEESTKISSTYHAWRGTIAEDHSDEKGFCAAVSLEDIVKQGYALTPGRFVGAPESEEEGVDFEERMAELTDKLADQFAESNRLTDEVKSALKAIGYEL